MSNPFEHIRSTINQFWEVEYPSYSPDQRLRYWLKQLKPAIQWEAKQGSGDPYQVFSPAALESWCAQDAHFPDLLPAIWSELGLEADKMPAIPGSSES